MSLDQTGGRQQPMAVPPGRLGRTCGLPSLHEHHRLKPMKPDLTLDHVKIETRDLDYNEETRGI